MIFTLFDDDADGDVDIDVERCLLCFDLWTKSWIDLHFVVGVVMPSISLTLFTLIPAGQCHQEVLHEDTGSLCNYSSWLSRGWCRGELWYRMLSSRSTASIMVMFSENEVEVMSHLDSRPAESHVYFLSESFFWKLLIESWLTLSLTRDLIVNLFPDWWPLKISSSMLLH